MMFIRLLAVLGALFTLAMAGTPAPPTRSPTKEKTMSPKAPKPPKASKSKSKPTPHPPPKGCGPPYDKGCTCFNKKDVDAFLAFAAKSGVDCFYREFNFTELYVWEIEAIKLTESNETDRYLGVGVGNKIDDQDVPDACENVYQFFDYSGLNFFGIDIDDSFFTVLEGSVATTCVDLIKDVKDQMMDLGCKIETAAAAAATTLSLSGTHFANRFGGKR